MAPPRSPAFTSASNAGQSTPGHSQYGAVATAKTQPWDIWCHFSHIDAMGYRALVEGQAVDVEYVRLDQDSFKYIATRVRPVTREE